SISVIDASQKIKAAAKKAADKKRKQLAAKNAAEKKQALARKKAEDAKRKKVQADKKAATEAKKAKAKAEAEKQRLEKAKLAEKARLAAEAKAREQARKDSLAQTIANEEALLEEEEALRSAMSYEAYVRDLISRHWRISPSARNGMKVELSIHLLPTGEVDNAYISQSSGDARFDRDAVSAVLRTARFPELQALDPVVFDRYYRKFTMIFRPEDLRY
ncbi:MAG: cell envelope integrity protein TolA, partial [Pontibacterium sp.]